MGGFIAIITFRNGVQKVLLYNVKISCFATLQTELLQVRLFTVLLRLLKPFEYLTYLLEILPNVDVKDPSVLDSLMPWSTDLPESCRLNNKSLQHKER
jgi:hypothetical protein